MLLDGRRVSASFSHILRHSFSAASPAGGVLALISNGNVQSGLGSNGYLESTSSHISILGAFVIEIILTFVFVFVVLRVTKRAENGKIAGFVIGLTLTLVHIFGIHYTGTSVNPARSFGPAFVSALLGNTAPLKQVWLFIAAPLAGAVIAVLVYRFLYCGESKKSE